VTLETLKKKEYYTETGRERGVSWRVQYITRTRAQKKRTCGERRSIPLTKVQCWESLRRMGDPARTRGWEGKLERKARLEEAGKNIKPAESTKE